MRPTLTPALVFLASVLASNSAHAQTCKKVGNAQECTIELQKAPNNMEPKDEPTRIRVDDRSQVRLVLKNLSPLDVCSLSGRTVTPTAETNPLESIVSSIAKLGGMAFGVAKTNTDNIRTMMKAHIVGQPISDTDYQNFVELAEQFSDKAEDARVKQSSLRDGLQKDLNSLGEYLAADYRADLWKNFDPASAVALGSVRNDRYLQSDWLTSETYAQVLLDQMTKLGDTLHKRYDDKAKGGDKNASEILSKVDTTLAYSKAVSAILSDNDTTLKSSQSTLRTNYNAALKAYDDFNRRQRQGVVTKSPDESYLSQSINLGTDRKATITGVLSCVSAADPTKATTDAINYSILYQNVPVMSASTGFLATFQEKRVIGTSTVFATNAAGYNTIFAVTDSARAQVLPMGYFNFRIAPYKQTNWFRRPEDELDFTTNLSAGLGLNPNTGTSQPEFFLGMAFGFNKLMIHPGIHFGRTQSLGGGFALNSLVPTGFSGQAPIIWSYHPAFSIGFSVRVAPW
jgi:hypothetical protein